MKLPVESHRCSYTIRGSGVPSSVSYIKQILVYMTRSGSWRFRVFRRGISFIGVTRTLLVGSVPRFVPQPPIITVLDPVPY